MQQLWSTTIYNAKLFEDVIEEESDESVSTQPLFLPKSNCFCQAHKDIFFT